MSERAHAATCTWTGATSNTFGQAGNWTGGGCGSGPPASGDTAQFNSGSVACNITANTTVAALTINGYTGTLTQSSGTLTVTGSYTQSSGTFAGGSETIDITGSFNLSSGTFTSTSGRLRVGTAFSMTGGAFNANSGQVMLNSTSSQTLASNGATFHDLTINEGLAGYWRLDAGSGSTASDSSGYGNSGTVSNTSWVTAASDLPSALAFKNDAAVSFNGSSSSIALGVSSFSNLNGAQTISMWVYYASVPAAQQSFTSIASGTNRNQIGFFDNAGARTIRVWRRVGTTDTSLVTASSTPASGWHHVAYTYNGSTHTLYVDGTSTTSTTAATSGTPGTATLGMRTDSAEFFSGRIDDVRVYKRALSGTEIGRVYAGGQPQTSAATQTLTGAPTITHDLVIASGTLAAGTNALTVGGSWWNYGGLYTGTGTVTFNGSATTNTILSGGQSFGAINLTGSGTWTLADALSMSTRAITVSAGALTGLSYSIRAGSITESGSGNFTPGTGTVTLDGSSNVTLPDGSYGGLTIDTSDSNLVGHWKLDEGSGTSFSDSSGYGNTGALVNGPTWSTSVSSTIQFADPNSIGIAGGGTNDHGAVTVSSLSLNPASGVTVAYWMYYPSVPAVSSDAVVLKSGGLLQTGFLKGSDGPCTGVCIAAWNSGGGGNPLAYKTSPSSAAGWYHFAYSWDGSNSKLYINGTEATGTTNAPTSSILNTVYLSTYDGANEDFTGGRLDDVRVYNTALTATQVQRLASGYSTYSAPPTYTLGGTTTVTGAFALTSGGITVGSHTLTASSGLTVGGNGTLTMATSGGVLAIGSGQSLIFNGTLNASSTGASIRSVSGNYAFSVGSTSTARPVLNVSGLAVQGTDSNGMRINVDSSAVTTFTRFDNIAFSNGTGTRLLQIYSPSLFLNSNGCSFDSEASASTTYSVTLTGNGTSDGETRVVFGGATCASSFASCQASKNDDDSDNNGIGNTPGSNGAVVQFVRSVGTDTAGTIEGLPTAAFDWTTFQYYSTYVAFHDVSGTVDRVYVRDQTGAAKYSWDTPSGETIVGTPRWNTVSGSHYLFVATASGKVYRLIDDGSSLTQASGWSANPFECSCTIVTPLGMDASNLYWGGTASGNKVWTLGQSSGSQPMGSPLTVTPAITTAAPALWTSSGTTYLFLGVAGHVLQINASNQTLAADNTNPGSASIYGRISIGTNGGNRVFAGDNGGNFWALDPSNFAGTAKHWSYAVSGDSIQSSIYSDHGTNSVQFGTEAGKVVALSSATGAAMTGYPHVPGTSSDAIRTAVFYGGGILAVGTTTGKLFFIDRNNGTTGPALVRQYYFGATQSVSGIGMDASANRYMVSTSDSSTKDGRIYYFDVISDPTGGSS